MPNLVEHSSKERGDNFGNVDWYGIGEIDVVHKKTGPTAEARILKAAFLL